MYSSYFSLDVLQNQSYFKSFLLGLLTEKSIFFRQINFTSITESIQLLRPENRGKKEIDFSPGQFTSITKS